MKVLIATDGSETAAAAVDFVARFPFPADASVTLLSVASQIHHRAEVLDGRHQEALDAIDNFALTEAEDIIAVQAKVFRDAGRPCSTQVRTGHPAEEIVMAAEETGADIIVVGSHGLTGVRRFLIGSVSSQVLQSAHCSVLIVRQSEEAGEGRHVAPSHGRRWRLLVAYDDSIPARKAVEFCASLPLGDSAEVEVLTVLPLVTMFRQDIRQELNETWRQTTETAKAALADAATRVGRATPNVRTVLVESGDVGDAIINAAGRLESDLIIMGNKGKGAIERFLMGSVTPRVAYHTDRSVLAIRPSRT